MKGTTQGFTLIELLIVIAIIGILAAVLIPNLLGARKSAGERAAQAHSANVATAVTAWLAASDDKKPSDAVAAAGFGTDCKNAAAVDKTATDGTTYGFAKAPNTVSACTIAGDDTTGKVTVTVTSTGTNTYVNGSKTN